MGSPRETSAHCGQAIPVGSVALGSAIAGAPAGSALLPLARSMSASAAAVAGALAPAPPPPLAADLRCTYSERQKEQRCWLQHGVCHTLR